MTEKELHKLRRHDLLQLLLAQGREAAQLQDRIRELTESQGQLQQANDRFIERLDDKDAQIQRLKDRLDEKDAQADRFKERLKEKDAQIEKLKDRLNRKDTQIEECRSVIEEYRSGRIFEMGGQVSIAEVGLKLEGIFTAAQKAVDQYLEEIHGKAQDSGPASDSQTENQIPGRDSRRKDSRDVGILPAGINQTGEQHEKETDRCSDTGSDTGAA